MEAGAGWLLLVYQLPTRPSRLRVKIWRRLQDLGALPVKNSVYVLPNSPRAREDFEWLKTEIEAMRGEASIFLAQAADLETNQKLLAELRAGRTQEYAGLRRAALELARRAARGEGGRMRLLRELRAVREQFLQATERDVLGAPGRREAEAALRAATDRIERHAAPQEAASIAEGEESAMKDYKDKTWVTRPRPGVDRMSSAWLIRHFIDPKAKFTFAETPEAVPRAIPFDMYTGAFSHHGNECTYETLLRRFGIADAGARRMARVIHQIDLKDQRYAEPEAPAVERLVAGLRAVHADDAELLERGMSVFAALHASFSSDSPHSTGAAAKPARRARGKQR